MLTEVLGQFQRKKTDPPWSRGTVEPWNAAFQRRRLLGTVHVTKFALVAVPNRSEHSPLEPQGVFAPTRPNRRVSSDLISTG
jgi:hypothetical protein